MADDNWAVQLKKIEREFDGLPPEPSPAVQKMQSEAERRAKEKTQQRAAMIGAGARLILVFALGAAIAVWPYSNDCGWGWFGYVGVEAVIVAGGMWVAFTTWRGRLPKMHVLSLLIILAGLTLIAAEVLPRVGYAAVDRKHPPQMWCPETTTLTPPRPVTMTNLSPAMEANLSPAIATNASPAATILEQRVSQTTHLLGSRWQESSSDLARRFRPQQASLAQTVHRELRLPQAP